MIDLILSPEEQAFRQEVQSFLQRELSDDIRQATAKTPSVFVEKDIALAWQRKLLQKGWLAPRWPVEHGGAGWSAMQRYIYDLEAALAGAPGMIPMGLGMVAPVIMKFGTPLQKAHYLPKILTGEHYWCQGYSEPQSGSDLASLQCRAVREGDRYIVNGTKLWTTHAHYATHIFVLVRTDPNVKPQQGISFLLMPMNTPGITVTPIKSFAGDHDVNQVFFDDAQVPVANRVGAEGQGWTCAKYLLEHERGGTFATPLLLRDLDNLKRLIRELGAGDASGTTSLRRRLTELEMDTYCLQQYEIQVAAGGAQSDPTAPSIIKTLFSETQQKITELAMDVAGPFATILDTRRPLYQHATVHELPHVETVAPSYLNFRAASIYAGTNEVQRTVIAKSVLGASPGAPIVFDEERQILLGSAEHFAAKFYSASMRAATEQSAAGFDPACWDKFIELGWQYLGIPARFDGLGGSPSDWMALAYGLGSSLLIEPLFSALALPAVLFAHARDEATAAAAFERMAAGEQRYAVAELEYPPRGAIAHEATVRRAGGVLLLTGKKTLVRHGAAATHLLVKARLVTEGARAGGVVILEVPASSPGVAVKSYRLMDGSSASDVSFDQVALDEAAVIVAERDSEAALDEMLALATAIACADSLKQIEVMLALTVDYLNSRSQFGTRLAGFQVLQHRVADMHMQREIAASALQRLLRQIDAKNDAGREIAVSLAKAQIDRAARFVGQQAIQLHGGIGITQELSVGAHFKRITTNEHWYGDRGNHLDRFFELASTTASEKSRTLSPVNSVCSRRSGA